MGRKSWKDEISSATEYKKLKPGYQKQMVSFVNNLSRPNEINFKPLLEKTKLSFETLKKYTSNYSDITVENLCRFCQDPIIDAFWLIRYLLGLSKDSFKAEIVEYSANMPKSYNAQLRKIRQNKKMAKIVIESLDEDYDLIQELARFKTPPTWEYLVYRLSIAMEGSALKGQHTGNYLENIIEDLLSGANIPFSSHRHPLITSNSNTFKIEKKIDFLIPTEENPCAIIEAKMYDSSGGSKQSDSLGDLDKVLTVTNQISPKDRPAIIFALDGRQWRYRVNDLAKFFRKLQDGEIQGLFQVENLQYILELLYEVCDIEKLKDQDNYDPQTILDDY